MGPWLGPWQGLGLGLKGGWEGEGQWVGGWVGEGFRIRSAVDFVLECQIETLTSSGHRTTQLPERKSLREGEGGPKPRRNARALSSRI